VAMSSSDSPLIKSAMLRNPLEDVARWTNRNPAPHL
jgi:hypothetical protein